MKIAICACRFYRRTPRGKIAALRAACSNAGVSCEIVPDLCACSATDRDKTEELAACDAVLACQPRAVRSMLGKTVAAKLIDLRTEPLDGILAALSLAAADVPDDEFVDESTPGGWVPWFPVIDADRCVHCGKCVDFCMFGVYAVERTGPTPGKTTVRVVRPDACKTDCPACARICPQNAIMFPKSEEEHLNGSLDEPLAPAAPNEVPLRERLKRRRLFKEDE